MKAIGIEAPGADYRLVVDTVPQPKPAPGQVLMAVAAAGLNNADLLQARGKYPPPPGASPILGMEVSGTIAGLGDGVSGWKEGDRVCAVIPGGGYAEYAIADAGSVLPVPDAIDLVEAAAPWGRIVNIAYQKSFKMEVNFTPAFLKQLTLAMTRLRVQTPEQKQAIRDALRREIWPLLGIRLRPVTARIFSLGEAQQA